MERVRDLPEGRRSLRQPSGVMVSQMPSIFFVGRWTVMGWPL